MEQTEEEEEEYGTEARGRGNGNGNGNGNGRNTGKTTAGAPAYGGARGARSSSHPNRRARYGDDHFGRGERGRGTAGPQPSSRNKAKAKGGVMKSVGKATGSSMKAMVHALQPKAVGLGEILDTWKIEQVLHTYIHTLWGSSLVFVRVTLVLRALCELCERVGIDLRACLDVLAFFLLAHEKSPAYVLLRLLSCPSDVGRFIASRVCVRCARVCFIVFLTYVRRSSASRPGG